MTRVATCLWFADNNGHEAAAFYCGLLPDSRITMTMPGETGAPVAVAFELMGTPYQALNGGDRNRLGEETSIVVATEDQAETDRLWAALADGGQEKACGWLVDRFVVHWQIAPKGLWEMMCDPDREAAGRAFAAMLEMVRIDIATVRAAFEGRA
ncbi:VOC family protein [Jannaschia formosa]|uniref:VOC family protein n=1 Tax=Jannaschia formosa TaxID=2259592 RepID=UPI000E1B566B|nr:VOC family protein [Jannaschia formosa]TFL18983.1 VOC family protein [Jannaschia formosa]